MADFVEVMKIKDRMCESTKIKNCKKCLINYGKNRKKVSCSMLMSMFPEQAQEILLKWDKEHPVKRNIDKFREVFGLTEEEFNPPAECSYIMCLNRKCDECPRKTFWLNEYKEPEVNQ